MILKYPEMAKGQVNDFFEGDKYPNWITQYEELQTHVGFARALISTTKNLVTLDDIHKKIDSLNIPVYTFWGEFDNVVVYDEFKDRLNKVFPNRKEFFITKSGHLPHMENQEEFENIFFKYLNN
jgi:pimeloyl-ACP methyl ester carboxylesterase